MSLDSEKRKPRRVVRLSRVDQERLDRGEISTPEDAVHLWDARPVMEQPSAKRVKADAEPSLSQRDREILGDRPPHFGKL